MKNNIKLFTLFAIIATFCILSCKKTDYSFGSIKTPTNLNIGTIIQGSSTANPGGDGSGNVAIASTATDALTYKIYFGNGDSALVPSGDTTYTYKTIGTNTYTITVVAIGTGGALSTKSKQVSVTYNYAIPANIMAYLTNGSSRNWVVDKSAAGHFGVGPSTSFSADWYNAAPNEKPSCAYGSIITFTKSGNNSITINNVNGGSSFIIGAATSFYGQSGGDGCYPVSTGGLKTLGFGSASSGPSSSNSTQIQFTVPGTGLIGFGTGGVQYEIMSISATNMYLRTIGIDGNAWYQKFLAQ